MALEELFSQRTSLTNNLPKKTNWVEFAVEEEIESFLVFTTVSERTKINYQTHSTAGSQPVFFSGALTKSSRRGLILTQTTAVLDVDE